MVFHITNTKPLDGDAVLVEFSDGRTAVYRAEELESLRLKRKDDRERSPR